MNFNTPSNRIQYKPVLLDNLFAYKVNPKYCVLRFGIRAAGSYFLAEVSTFMFHHVFESFKYKKKVCKSSIYGTQRKNSSSIKNSLPYPLKTDRGCVHISSALPLLLYYPKIAQYPFSPWQRDIRSVMNAMEILKQKACFRHFLLLYEKKCGNDRQRRIYRQHD